MPELFLTLDRMLFEFHRQQNAKKPGSIHATYLLCGIRRKEETSAITVEKDGDDVHMQNSPFMSSMPHMEGEQEVTAVQTIILVKEEDLDKVTSSFEKLSSIHIYSLELGPLHDLQTISDATRKVTSIYGHEDPIEHGKIYGTIHNTDVRRRQGRRPSPQNAPLVPTQRPKAAKEEPKSEKSESQKSTNAKPPQSSATKDFFNRTQSDEKPTPPTSQKPTNTAPTLKRDSSSIFKAFAKAKPKPEATDSSAAPSVQASAAADSPMKDISDDDEDDYVAPPQASKDGVDRDRQARKEREAALRKMMEDDDEVEIEQTSNESPAEVDGSEFVIDKSAESEPEPVVKVEDGRRRGKRRVMKKKTMKDEEGYLGMYGSLYMEASY